MEVDPREIEGRVFGIPFGRGTWTSPADWETIAWIVGIDTPDFLLLEVTATNEDGTALNDVVFYGVLDSRALGLEGDDGPYDACDTGYIACYPCDDGEPYCMDVVIQAGQGQWLDGFDLDETYEPINDAECL